MKRDPALISLSHEHHHALVLAQRLRRANAESASGDRAAFLAFWDGEGQAHFELEEWLLFPEYAGHGDPHHPLLARALCDHALIRHRAGALEREQRATPAELHELGVELADHVRLEERELFPLIEQALPRDRLAAVAAALAAAEAS